MITNNPNKYRGLKIKQHNGRCQQEWLSATWLKHSISH